MFFQYLIVILESSKWIFLRPIAKYLRHAINLLDKSESKFISNCKSHLLTTAGGIFHISQQVWLSDP